jgi:hypothetical protein
VTETFLPACNGVYADSRGSAFCRTGMISGEILEMKFFELFAVNRERWYENSDSVASDGWTERTTSLARYATLATVQ